MHNFCMHIVDVSVFYAVIEDKFPGTIHIADSVAQETTKNVTSVLHSRENADDSILFKKSHVHQSSIMSLLVFPLHHVKHINPSEIESEFHYITGHVIELLSHCHPTLLIERCRQLMASHILKIKLFSVHFIDRLRNLKFSVAVLRVLSVFWSWSNHSILTFLAQFSELAVTLLEEFNSRMMLSYSILLYPCISTLVIPNDDNNYAMLTLDCECLKVVTLKVVYNMQSLLIEKCDITEHALQLVAVEKNPIKLQWIIPIGIVDLINKKVEKHLQYFESTGIATILIDLNAKCCIKHDMKAGSIRVLFTEEVCNYALVMPR